MALYIGLQRVIRKTGKESKIEIAGLYQMKAKKVDYKLESNLYLNFENSHFCLF